MSGARPLLSRPPVAGGVDVDLPGKGVRLRGTRWRGSGTPVLLLHGLASTRRFWDLVVPGLAPSPVLALDQRGHGDSERPEGPYDAATVATDALTALDALGLSRAVVVGHSWGASVALQIAAIAPERVLAVVAIDGGLSWGRLAIPDRAVLRERLTPPDLAHTPDELPEVLRAGALAPWWSPEVEAAVLPIFETTADGSVRARLPRAAHLAIVDDLIDADPERLLPSIGCPVWLVACLPAAGAGGDDWAAAKVAALERASALLARPRALRWQGAVHDVPLQWPALVAGLVRAAAEEAAGESVTTSGNREGGGG